MLSLVSIFYVMTIRLFVSTLPWQCLQVAPRISRSTFLVAVDMGSFSGDGTILAFLAGGAWSKIPTSLSSLELSPETELISSSELSSSLDESELDPVSEPLPSDLGLFPAIWENKNI